MKKTLLLLAGCLMFISAVGQRQSSFADGDPEETYLPSYYDIPKSSTFMPDQISKNRATYIGQRLDVDLSVGIGSLRLKPTKENEAYIKAGLAATGYLVFINRKDALGLTLDVSYENLFNKAAYTFSMLTGPAYSHNFTPFAKNHISLDLAAGYLLRRHQVSPNVNVPKYHGLNMKIQHTLGFRAGVSVFTWVLDVPMEYRLNLYMPFGTAILNSGSDKKKFDSVLGNDWNVSLSIGFRFGNY